MQRGIRQGAETDGRVFCSQAGVSHVAESLIGFAPQEITRYAEEVDAHMIVMGAHGRGVLLDAVIGSVAGRVLALTQRPVLLIQHPGDAQDQTQ